MRLALDSNVLVYAEGVNGPARQAEADDLIDMLANHDIIIPVQVLGEVFNVLVRKAAWERTAAVNAVLSWREGYEIAPTTQKGLVRAIELAREHRLSIWDAIILAVAAQTGCGLLLSEDMQDGFVWSGVTITNPFAPCVHPLLVQILSGAADR